MSAAQDLFSVSQKLNGTNYAEWAFQMKSVLKQAKVWRIVTEQETNLELTPGEMIDFLSRWDLAVRIITESIEPGQFKHIQDIVKPAQMWTQLQTVYKQLPDDDKTIHVPVSVNAAISSSLSSLPQICTFCESTQDYHKTEDCNSFQSAKLLLKNGNRQPKDNPAQIPIMEFAGNATALVSSNGSSSLVLTAGNNWVADSGATSHMTPHRTWFHDYKPYVVPIRLANGLIIKSEGIGTVIFKPSAPKTHTVEFSRVLHVPQLQSNLLSILYLTQKKDFAVTIVKDKVSFCKDNVEWFTASVNDSYSALLDGVTLQKTEFAGRISTCTVDWTLWHRRFSHLNHNDVKQLQTKGLVNGMTLESKSKPDPICEPCLAGKQHREVNKVATNRASEPLELIHTDLHGPMPVRTPEGYRYWVTFIDDATRFMSVSPLKRKSEALNAFKQFKTTLEKQTGFKIKIQRDDKGGEYKNTAYDKFCQSEGILRQHTVTNEPHQNGVAERANRTLDEGVTSMLEESHLPPSMWFHALSALVHT